MNRLMALATCAVALTCAAESRAADDLWRSQLEVGGFDFDHKANSASFDLQLRPGWRLWDFGVFAGGMITTRGALFGYGGVTLDLKLTDHIVLLPDAAVGYYQHRGDKNLGNTAEFRTGLGLAYEFDDGWRLGADFHHISNAGLATKNPGVEIAALTLAVPLFGPPHPVNFESSTTTAAPPPAPAPEAPKSYLVFFDFDKSDLTAEAQKIVRSAADNATKANTTKIEVTGHTDTSGSDAYNMRLSKRRAVSVEEELVKDGVSRQEIAIFAKGKREPLVPTGDGVREPQNRRVQIVLD
ncbi:MAG TPA: acyloxyacyl hydrolase [Alphaproteobacteria bacterium]|nr:acyloxyacyl hydrolase [Alphaproteobacteria bacterium]